MTYYLDGTDPALEDFRIWALTAGACRADLLGMPGIRLVKPPGARRVGGRPGNAAPEPDERQNGHVSGALPGFRLIY